MKTGFSVLLIFLSLKVCAQQDKINTDLPDQSDGTYVLEKGNVQLEEKIWYNYLSEHPNPWISTTMLRAGVVKNLELRLLVEEGKGRDIYMEETAESLSPLAVSAKWSVLKNHKILPDFTFVTYLQLPFTSKTSEKELLWSPAFLLAAEKKIKRITMGFNGGWKEHAFDPQGSWSLVYSLRYQLSHKTQVFLEYFGQYANLSHPLHNADAGIQYDLRSRIQLFLTTGTTINAEEYQSFAATGFAFKLF